MRRVRRHCDEPDCNNGAVGRNGKCKGHGGGRRCDEPDCDKGAVGSIGKCIAHGGGRRCDEPSFPRESADGSHSARAGPKRHAPSTNGGGKRSRLI